jgi:hypothetical protein
MGGFGELTSKKGLKKGRRNFWPPHSLVSINENLQSPIFTFTIVSYYFINNDKYVYILFYK